VPIVFHRPIPKGFKVKTGTIIPEAEGWYICLRLENQTVRVTVAEIQPTAENSLGIDLAITNYAYLSNGEGVKNQRFLRTSAEKLARLQAKLAKRVKRSKSGKTIKKIVLNYESGGGSTSLKKALASREKEACGLTVLR
jgi:putative transposase